MVQWLDCKQSNLLVLLVIPILCCQQKLASFSTSLHCNALLLAYGARAFRDTGLWRDLSHLEPGIFGLFKTSLVDLRSQRWGLGRKLSLWNVPWVIAFQPTSGAFIQKLCSKPTGLEITRLSWVSHGDFEVAVNRKGRWRLDWWLHSEEWAKRKD